MEAPLATVGHGNQQKVKRPPKEPFLERATGRGTAQRSRCPQFYIKGRPMQMTYSVGSGYAVLVLPEIRSFADLGEIEEAVALQLRVARRRLENQVEEDWAEALRQKPMWETQL